MAPRGGVFVSHVTVTVTSAAAEVRFTLDGSVPTTNSPRYAAPLQISNSCVLHVRAFGQPGSSAAETYTLLETNLLDFNSNLPLVLIQTFGHTIQPDTNVMVSVRFIDTGTNNRASIRGAGNFDGRAGVKTRGYSSRRYPKRSLSLETRTPEGESQHVPLLGFPKDSDWVLYAPYPDKTMLRDVLAYELSNQIGRWAPRTKFVELFLNETGGKVSRRDYLGVYVFEEKVKRDKNRVNIA
ncbi:MAG TPA: CotH kinase family protein, partial [Verrucomicrobiae bacterium]